MEALRKVAKKLPTVILPDSINDVMDEWKLFALDPYVGEIINSTGQLTQYEPKIDLF